MEKENYFILSIVGLVAIVGLVLSLSMSAGSSVKYSVLEKQSSIDFMEDTTADNLAGNARYSNFVKKTVLSVDKVPETDVTLAPLGYGWVSSGENQVMLAPGGGMATSGFSCSGCSSCKKKSLFGNGMCDADPECSPCSLNSGAAMAPSVTPTNRKAMADFSAGKYYQADCNAFNIQLPPNAQTNIIGSTVYYSYSTPGGSAVSGSITCNCNEGTGQCNPFSVDGTTGCAMYDGCTSCSQSGGAAI